MNVRESFLPWTGAPVRVIDDLQLYLCRQLPQEYGAYLPRSITLFIDPEVTEKAVQDFLSNMVSWLDEELTVRRKRSQVFIQLGLFREEEMKKFLTGRTGAQPWAIYYSAHGGLGLRGEDQASSGAERGVIPCSSMKNHGVAWAPDGHGATRVWLATARKESQGWDWDSDIGHESCHAAFAQVPFFTQLLADEIDQSSLSQVGSVDELGPAAIARMAYFYSEIAVVAVRGENRQTASGLPIAEMPELHRLLELSDQLSPRTGFQRAIAAILRCGDMVDVNRGQEIYEIAAPVMKVVPRLTRFASVGEPPDLSTFHSILAV